MGAEISCSQFVCQMTCQHAKQMDLRFLKATESTLKTQLQRNVTKEILRSERLFEFESLESS